MVADHCIVLYDTFKPYQGNDYSVWPEFLNIKEIKKGEKILPKVIIGRLEMIGEILDKYGIGKDTEVDIFNTLKIKHH